MALLKYITLLILIFSCKISVAQTWADEFNTGVSFSNKGDYHSALQHFHQANAKYNTDTIAKDYATLLYAIGDMYFQTEVYDTSLIFLKRAFALRKIILTDDDVDYERSLNKIGAVYYKLKNYSKALELFEIDLALTEKIYANNSKEYVVAVSNLANVYNKLERYDKAEEYYINVLQLKEQIFGKESSEYSSTLTWLANLYMTTEEYKKAEPLCIEAIEIRKKISGTEHPYYINNVIRLAQLYKNTSDYSKAEPLYLEALSLQEKTVGINHPDYISLLYDLGYLYLKNGNYNQAETYLLRSANKIELLNGKENPDYAKTLNALGALYLALDDYNKAEKYFEDALAIREKYAKLSPAKYFESLNNLAELYRSTGYETSSIRLYEVAIEYHKKVGDTLSISYATTINNLAIAYSMREDYKTAESLFIKALGIIKNRTGENSREYIHAIKNMGTLYLFYLKNDKKAEDFFLLSLAGNRKLDNSQLIDLYSSLAFLYSNQQKYLTAIEYELLSIQIEHKLISNYSYFMSANQLEQYLFNNERKFLSFNNYLYGYSKQIPDLSKQSYNNELQNKGLILRSSQQVQNTIIKSRDTALINTLEYLRGIKNRLSQYYLLPIDNRPDNINELEADAEQLEKKLVQGSQAYRNLKVQFSLTWKDVQNRLDTNEAAIEFISFNYYNKNWTDSILYGALVLRPEYSQPKFIYLFEEKQLTGLLKKEDGTLDQSYINRLYKQRESGNQLYKLIWQPLDSLLSGVTTVYAAPSGLLHNIALGAIPSPDGKTVESKYGLRIVGTTADITNKKEDFIDKKSVQRAIVFGGINFDIASSTPIDFTTNAENNVYAYVPTDSTRGASGKWNYLGGTFNEAEEIANQFNAQKITTRFYSDSTATETLFKNMPVTGSTIIHIATHGYFFPDIERKMDDRMQLRGDEKQTAFKASENPLLRSGLIFAGANPAWTNPDYVSTATDDGILTAYEISNMDLSNVKLAVLSACETGLGDIKGSEGVFGLQRAFKLAGVKNIIMSLWKVPDEKTRELMQSFYQFCFDGKSISEAFKSAQEMMRTKYQASPYYWAGFILLE